MAPSFASPACPAPARKTMPTMTIPSAKDWYRVGAMLPSLWVLRYT